MDKQETKVIVLGVCLLAVFISALVYAFIGLGIRFPECFLGAQPFKEGKLIRKSLDHYELHYVAKMWSFDPDTVTVPEGSTVDIFLTSQDVTHGFQIMHTNVNLMAVPGTVNSTQVKFSRPGEYRIVCHEYCGAAHHQMLGRIQVMPRDKEILPESGPTGASLLQSKGCLACHSTTGSKGVGPSFLGLFGREEKLEGGSTVIVDEPYLKESILNPSAKITQGFQPSMPQLTLTDSEISLIIEHIKTLK